MVTERNFILKLTNWKKNKVRSCSTISECKSNIDVGVFDLKEYFESASRLELENLVVNAALENTIPTPAVKCCSVKLEARDALLPLNHNRSRALTYNSKESAEVVLHQLFSNSIPGSGRVSQRDLFREECLGSFAYIPQKIIAHILNFLPLKDRVITILDVCKSFQTFKDEPCAWQTVALEDYEDGPYVRILTQVMRGILYTKHLSISLHSRERSSVCKLLRMLHSKVSHLSISGFCVNKPLITTLCMQPFVQNLKSLYIGNVPRLSDNFYPLLLLLAKQLASLEYLGLTHRFDSVSSLHRFADALGHARGDGAYNLLRGFSSTIHANALLRIGTLFPEIEELIVRVPPFSGAYLNPQACPRLRVVCLKFCDRHLDRFLPLLISACVRLEVLKLMGVCRHPCYGGEANQTELEFSSLLRQPMKYLTHLELRSLTLSVPTSIVPHEFSMPSLQKFVLIECHSTHPTLLTSLHTLFPKPNPFLRNADYTLSECCSCGVPCRMTLISKE